MGADGLSRVAVVGAGFMGSGIAESAASAGIDVTIYEPEEAPLKRSRQRLAVSVDRAVSRGKLTAEDAERLTGRVAYTSEFEDLAGVDAVLEAVTEDPRVKGKLFQRLDEALPEARFLASNTSSIPIVELAAATGDRAEHVLGLHFFNPVPVLALVEIIPSLLTDDAVSARATAFAAEQLGKDPIQAPDRAGFTVNALLIPYVLSAIRMFEQGLATAEDIDRGMVKGCAHPMGPLALADLIGLDTVMGVAETLYAEHREQLFAPPPLLQRLVAAGLLGRKTGRGLYSYN
jgi:3-hydroxybutyryl-CoA dehydrogenase